MTYQGLKAKQRQVREKFPEPMGLRVHRSISWIGRAEQVEDADTRFIFLWIAFNAAYADEEKLVHPSTGSHEDRSERSIFAEFFQKVVSLDREKRIYDAICKNFSGPIRLLMAKKYVYSPFWQHQNGVVGFENWECWFYASKRRFNSSVKNQDTIRVLNVVFDRLYVLRNQILHGGSTWNSGINREQVNDGASILGFLVPQFIDLMMDNPCEDWGEPFYPVVD